MLVRALPLPVLFLALVVAGFASGGMIIGFAFAKESVPARLTGTASGVINTGVMMGGMVLQPAVGWVLDRNWNGAMQGGARIYDLQAYQAGFALLLGWVVLTVILVAFTRETRCRQIA